MQGGLRREPLFASFQTLWGGEIVMMGLVAFLAAATAAAGSHVDIQVGSVTLRVPIPAGFCKPAGNSAAAMQLLAASDPRNVTHVSFVECKKTPAHRYILLKTPVQALNADLELTETLKGLDEAVGQPELVTKMNSEVGQQVGDDKSKILGAKVEVATQFSPRGRDDICVYIGGLMTGSIEGSSETQALATCMTVAGNRMISISVYEDTTNPEAYRLLMAKSRQLALTIKAVR